MPIRKFIDQQAHPVEYILRRAKKVARLIDRHLTFVPLLSGQVPGTPPNRRAYLYMKDDGSLYVKNDAGVEVELSMIVGVSHAAKFDGDGTHVWELPADATDPTGGALETGDIEVSITANNGDAHEKADNSGFSSSSQSLFVGNFGSASAFRVGFVFENVQLKQGTTIVAAKITLEQAGGSFVDLQSTIKGEDVDDSADFTATADVTDRTRTTAGVTWDATLTVDGVHDSPEIKTIVQEITDRASWVSGNAMCIILDGTSTTNIAAFAAYDHPTKLVPKLTVSWSGPDTTTGVEGRIPFKAGGTTRYIPYY